MKTPETDEKAFYLTEDSVFQLVRADFARKLENQRDIALEYLKEAIEAEPLKAIHAERLERWQEIVDEVVTSRSKEPDSLPSPSHGEDGDLVG